MWPWIPTILGTFTALVSGYLVWQNSDAARKDRHEVDTKTVELEQSKVALERRKVNRDELESAKDFWKDTMEAAQKRIDSLERELATTRAREREYSKRISVLEDTLRINNIRVPNGVGE